MLSISEQIELVCEDRVEPEQARGFCFFLQLGHELVVLVFQMLDSLDEFTNLDEVSLFNGIQVWQTKVFFIGDLTFQGKVCNGVPLEF